MVRYAAGPAVEGQAYAAAPPAGTDRLCKRYRSAGFVALARIPTVRSRVRLQGNGKQINPQRQQNADPGHRPGEGFATPQLREPAIELIENQGRFAAKAFHFALVVLRIARGNRIDRAVHDHVTDGVVRNVRGEPVNQ